jgi:hypothetical protein
MPIAIKPALALGTLVLLVAVAGPAARAADSKTIAASQCAAYGPDTTAAELTFSPTGVYNGGTTNEKVLCALPRDQDLAYAASELYLSAYYRVLGGTPGRMTCTVFVNSTSQYGVVTTATASGGLVSGGTQSSLNVAMPAQGDSINSSPVTAICLIPPKTSFSSMIMTEMGTTG